MHIPAPDLHQINTDILVGTQGGMAVKHVGAFTVQFNDFSLLPTLAVQTTADLSAEQKYTSSTPAEVPNDLSFHLIFIKGRLYLCSSSAFELEGIGESPMLE